MSNSVDPDETAHDEPSHLDLRCLQKTIFFAHGGERVNAVIISYSEIAFIIAYLRACFVIVAFLDIT